MRLGMVRWGIIQLTEEGPKCNYGHLSRGRIDRLHDH